jgi:hypothetical protein
MLAGLGLFANAQTGGSVKHKRVVVKRLYTGADGLTHMEEVEAKFTETGDNDHAALLNNAGAVLRRNSPGTLHEWHIAQRRQYAFTLAGEEEIEIAGGQKIIFRSGDIELAEDTTGKGHRSRTIGNEENITLMVPVVETGK